MKQSTQGKLVIISIFGISILMSGYAWWHNVHTGDQVIRFFGIEAATRLRHAETIELLLLDNSHENQPIAEQPTLKTSTGEMTILSVQDISSARGMVHMQHTFIQDHTYRWDQSLPDLPLQWAFALRFTDQAGQTTFLFDPAAYAIEHQETGQQILMSEMMNNLVRYLLESKLVTEEDVTSDSMQ